MKLENRCKNCGRKLVSTVNGRRKLDSQAVACTGCNSFVMLDASQFTGDGGPNRRVWRNG